MSKITSRVKLVALLTFGLLALALATASCGGSVGPSPSLTDAASPAAQDGGALTVAAGGGTLTHESGASVDLPPGALPQGTKIRMAVVDPPALPEGAEPVGSAYEISADSQITVPATVSLPIVGNPDRSDILIYRVQDDGTVMLLASSLDGDSIVAATPGFSIFIVGTGKKDWGEAVVLGKASIAAGETALYSAIVQGSNRQDLSTQSYLWMLCGEEIAARIEGGGPCGVYLTLPGPSGRSVTVNAGDQTGNAVLQVEILRESPDPSRWPAVFYFKYIVITIKAEMSVELLGPTFPRLDENVMYQAKVHYGPGGLLVWRWDFDDGTSGSRTQEEVTLELPEHRYSKAGTYAVMVSVVVVDSPMFLFETALRVEVEDSPLAE